MLQKDVNWMYICTLYEVCFSSFYFHFLGNKTNAWWLLKRMNFEVALNVYIYIYILCYKYPTKASFVIAALRCLVKTLSKAIVAAM